MEQLLEIKNLGVHFRTIEGTVVAVDNVSFPIYKGQNMGVVGESGCGKSVMAQSILRILDSNGSIVKGEILFSRETENGHELIDIAKLDERGNHLKNIRGKGISMIFQEPMTSFCPVYRIGEQISESLIMHRGMSKEQARVETIEMLRKVEISNPAQRFGEYPGQLSGGMRQRAMIAMALCCNPQLLIADEPTTALDVTVQAQVLSLLKELQQKFGMTIMIISHNLRVIADIADVVMVMYLGRIMEIAPVKEIYYDPRHPYTAALIESIPKLDSTPDKELSHIKGDIPNVYGKPKGCQFHPRCPDMIHGLCDTRVPRLAELTPGHKVSCFKYSDEVASDE